MNVFLELQDEIPVKPKIEDQEQKVDIFTKK